MAGRIPQAFIDDLLQRTDIVDVIESYVPLKKMGANYAACCPFHQEKTPSFTVAPIKQFFHCFGCGMNGNVISFIMEYERADFVEAVEILASRHGLTVPKREQRHTETKTPDTSALLAQVAVFYQQQLRQHPQAIAYLKKREFSGAIAKHFQLGFAPPGWDNLAKVFPVASLMTAGMLVQKETNRCYDRFRERIMFPIHDQRGRVVGFGGRVLDPQQMPKYLNSPETPVFQKNKVLYGLYHVLQQQRRPQQVIIVEGYLDVIALAQYGIDYAVATLGTAVSEYHIKLLLRYTDKIIFCFDGDVAGKQAAWRGLETSLPILRDGLELQFMFLPAGDDPDSLVRRIGAEAFIQLPAISAMDFLFKQLSEQTNISTLSGKSRLIHLALPLLQKLPHNAYRMLAMRQLSQWVKTDVSTLEQQLTPDKRPTQTAQPKQPSAMRMAIALLIQHPELAQQHVLQLLVPEITGQGSKLLRALFELLQEKPQLTTASLIEHWREHKHYPLLSQLASESLLIPVETIPAEFTTIIHHLLRGGQQRKIEQLLHKANTHGLEEQERQLLQQLIQTMKKGEKKQI